MSHCKANFLIMLISSVFSIQCPLDQFDWLQQKNRTFGSSMVCFWCSQYIALPLHDVKFFLIAFQVTNKYFRYLYLTLECSILLTPSHLLYFSTTYIDISGYKCNIFSNFFTFQLFCFYWISSTWSWANL